MIYKITEKQNTNSIADGYDVEAGNLREAKLIAKRGQMFYGTTLTIEEADKLIAYCEDKKWVNIY